MILKFITNVETIRVSVGRGCKIDGISAIPAELRIHRALGRGSSIDFNGLGE